MIFSAKGSSRFLAFLTSLMIFLFFATPVFSANRVIATLSDFSGTVLIKSRGAWAVKPTRGLPLDSQDKVVTRIGSATITFSDGAILEIKSNSNLLIEEREKDKGLVRKIKVIERRVLLFLGKVFFRTGKADIETRFETATAVVGIRGTAGTLSIAADGEVYVEFVEGEAAYFVGDFIEGVAIDVPPEEADKNAIQRAAFLADAAAEECKKAEEKADRGEITKVQAEWVCARALWAAGNEVKVWATIWVEKNPDPEVIERLEERIIKANDMMKKAIEAEEAAVAAGAVPEEPEAYMPLEAPVFDVPMEPEINIQDLEPASAI